jgi:hypothetical protein
MLLCWWYIVNVRRFLSRNVGIRRRFGIDWLSQSKSASEASCYMHTLSIRGSAP